MSSHHVSSLCYNGTKIAREGKSLRKKVACLHAHHSNIEYSEKAFQQYDVDTLHFVDPGLLICVTQDASFRHSDAQRKAAEQIAWIEKCGADAILITCTNYIALLEEANLNCSIPILKIDEPYFEALCRQPRPPIMLFTNPATVEGTVKRFTDYAKAKGSEMQPDVRVLEGVFPLIMQGKKEEYLHKICAFLHNLVKEDPEQIVSVAQLSMVEAAQQFERQTSIPIIHPLGTLQAYIADEWKLNRF